MLKNKSINIKQIAQLVNLELNEAELQQFSEEIPATLQALNNLNELSTNKITPTYQTTGLVNRYQNEKLNERSLSKQKVFQNCKNCKNSLFVVKGLKYFK